MPRIHALDNGVDLSTGVKALINKINLVVMGTFTYPRGMAGTKRIQNLINALKQYPDISIRVILQRQSTEHNILSGVHEGTPYETVMGDLFRAKMFVALPLLYYRTIAALKRAFRPDHKNVIYFYGPLFLESVVPLSYAQRLGYKIVFDVIEDYGLAKEVSRSFYQYVRSSLANRLSSRIKDLAAGIIVISSYLEEKCRDAYAGQGACSLPAYFCRHGLFPWKTRQDEPIRIAFLCRQLRQEGRASGTARCIRQTGREK